VQVLFTDVHMPNSMDGLDLAGQVHARWPHTLLLISSGYARPGLDEIPDARSQTTAVSCRSRIAAPPWCTASQG
jgi:CheY-like chemotaxis protein